MRKKLNETLMSDAEANDIMNIWKEMKTYLSNDIKSDNKKNDSDVRFLLYSNTFKTNTNTVGEINVQYVFYIVPNNHVQWSIENKLIVLPTNSEADYDKKTIIIRGLYYDETKKLNEIDTYTALSHEFHHLYQYQQGFSKNDYLGNLYDRCVKGATSKNQIIKTTSNLLYRTFKHEISAFSVQLYNMLSKNVDKFKHNIPTVNELMKLCEEYQNYLQLKVHFEYLFQDYDNVYETIENYFGITVDIIDKRINNADKIFLRYFDKVHTKFINLINSYGHKYLNEMANFMIYCYDNHYKNFEED